jgi:hypothetical protein
MHGISFTYSQNSTRPIPETGIRVRPNPFHLALVETPTLVACSIGPVGWRDRFAPQHQFALGRRVGSR